MRIIILSIAAALTYSTTAMADSCLKDAAEFAKNICGEISRFGNSQLTEANGQLKANVSGIVKKVVGGGSVSLDAKHLRNAYENVLRGDLTKELSDNRACRREMAKVGITEACKATPTTQPKLLDKKTKQQTSLQPNVIFSPAVQQKKPDKSTKQVSSLQPNVIFSPPVYIGMPKEKIPNALGINPDWKLTAPNSSQIYLTKNTQFAGVNGVAFFYVENDKLVVARLTYSSKSGSKSWEPRFNKDKTRDETFGLSAETHQKQCTIFRESFLSTLLASYSPPTSTTTPRDISSEVENWNKGSRVEIRQASQVTTKLTFDRNEAFSDLRLENTAENIDFVEHRQMSGTEIGTNSFQSDTCQAVLVAYLKPV